MICEQKLFIVVQKIQQAFGSMKMPPIDVMVERTDWEAPDIKRMLSQVKDGQMGSSEIERLQGSLPALTAVGLIYVMPQFMTYSIENPSSRVTDGLLFRLMSLEPGNEFREDFLRIISVVQKTAIYEYLDCLEAIHPESELIQEEIEKIRKNFLQL